MKKVNSSETIVEIKFVGGNGREEVNRILAKIVLERLAEQQQSKQQKEQKYESSNIYKG